MKAAVYYKYGAPEVLHFSEVEKPTIEAHEVLIKLQATTVTSGDVRMRRGTRKSLPLWPVSKLAIGLFKPKKNILGFDFAGEIEAVGESVTKYQVGDQVFGLTGGGTNVTYRKMSEDAVIVIKPENMTFDEATSLPFGALTANHFLKMGNIQAGQKVLIYGASGAVGTYAVQLAKHYGAEVTAVCSGKNIGLVKALGADYVIDYKVEDYTNTIERYDVVFDTVGKTDYKQTKTILKDDGVCLLTVFSFKEVFQMIGALIQGKKKIKVGISEETIESLTFVKELAEAGVLKSVIDKRYMLDDIVEAHRYVETGRKIGNVVIKFD